MIVMASWLPGTGTAELSTIPRTISPGPPTRRAQETRRPVALRCSVVARRWETIVRSKPQLLDVGRRSSGYLGRMQKSCGNRTHTRMPGGQRKTGGFRAARLDLSRQGLETPANQILLAIVVQNTGRRRPLDAGDGAQVFVDGLQFMIGHVAEGRPGHDLQQIAVERRRQTIAIGSPSASRVNVIEIGAMLHDLYKFRKRVTAFGASRFVRRQIARDDVRKRTRPGERTEIHASAQVCVGIDFCRLPEIGIPPGSEFRGRIMSMAAVAVGLRVYDEAA